MRSLRRNFLIAFGFIIGSTLALRAEPKPLFQRPAISATQIAFVYGGDLWIVGRGGGVAHRLTTGAGGETRPYFPPDGKDIAFTAQYDGNLDVYIIPAAAARPQQPPRHPSPHHTHGRT